MKSRNITSQNQQGMTSIGWLIVISIIGFFALLGIKLLPMYMGDMEVRSALEGMKEDKETWQFTKRELRRNLAKRLTVSTWTEHVKVEDLEVTKNKDGTKTVSITYEARENFAGNIFIIIVFSNEVEITRG